MVVDRKNRISHSRVTQPQQWYLVSARAKSQFPNNNTHPRTRSNHRHKYRTLASSTNILRYSFTHRTVPEWNALPASTVEAGTPDGFKARLAGLSAQSD